MTVREAVALVLEACVAGMGEAALPGGDQGGIFVHRHGQAGADLGFGPAR